MEIVSYVIMGVLCLFSLFLIAVVLLQSGKQANLGAVSGGAEAIMGKQKARGMDAVLSRLTKIAAIGFMVLAVVLVLIQRFFM